MSSGLYADNSTATPRAGSGVKNDSFHRRRFRLPFLATTIHYFLVLPAHRPPAVSGA
jgi:hypothetical protein